ncbi:glycosyltransferase family 4 protein [Microbacterium sp.]|uniref:glycosyltransferase family 4 protein n=1 Tax=Microbacterium sp. TaxID=51671 RepID=UPI0039E66128
MHGAARIVDAAARRLGVAAEFLRLGRRGYRLHQHTLREAHAVRGATFANSVTTTFTPQRADAWHRVHWRHVVVVAYGAPAADVGAWLTQLDGLMHAFFLLGPDVAARAGRLPREHQVADGTNGAPAVDVAAVLTWMHRERRRWDLVFVDTTHPLPDPEVIVRLQHAAHEYHWDGEIGFVTPAYRTAGTIAAGYQVDRRTGQVTPSLPSSPDYGQVGIPRYVLLAAAHCFYATSSAIDRVDVAGRHLAGAPLDTQVARLVRRGWGGNIRTLCLSSAVVPVDVLPEPELEGEQRRWLLERKASTRDGACRIIFVLNATSISGGIRIVFELANGLARRGFDVEIWSLEDTPSWFDLEVPVARYRTYDDLLLSLRNEDAIKVATWWETAEIVWLASVSHGIPVYLIQEFETWFYPDDAVARAAVVASYRRELIAVTEASYQRAELAAVGMAATLIPNGYDPTVFHELEGWRRDQHTVLALGRSFFQKNFEMTVRAWRSLGEQRPRLLLFGTEPDILQDERVDYRERPRDAEVNELYNTATVFVQTSRHEGFCLPILEAMAAGCPVIATDSHGNRDFCRDGENCIIVAQDDDVALAAAIRRLLGDPEERERLAREGLRTAARYRWPLVLDAVAEFYRSVAAAGSAGEPCAQGTVDASEG